MKWRGALLWTIVSFHAAGSAGVAGTINGEWLGGFQGRRDWIYVEVRIGGEAHTMTGRMDLPLHGERGILLDNVKATADKLSFVLPGARENLRFDGSVKDDGRITGTVRQGDSLAAFELLPARRLAPAEVDALAGDYQGTSPEDVVLLYRDSDHVAYLDHVTGRVGRLFPLKDGRFVSGPTVSSGYPAELIVSFERGDGGRIGAMSWRRKGESPRTLHRRTLYSQQPAQFTSRDGTLLSGALLVPSGGGPHPAVVIVPGSGKTTRDALMPFADSLARHGIAVLVHDKRGVGRSTGNYARAGIVELADDALAGIDWLKQQPIVDTRRIGVLGTSLGGWAAPLVAIRSADVKFIVVEAAPAITPAEHERLRVENQMRADGQTRENLAQALNFMDRKFEVGRTGHGWERLQALAARGERDGWLGYVNPPGSLESLRWNWEHVFSFDPQPVLRQLRVPVLALYGQLDRIVEPQFNRAQMEHALRAAGNRNVTVHVFPKANHNFFAAMTGGPTEVPHLKGFVAGYFSTRLDWLLKQVSRG